MSENLILKKKGEYSIVTWIKRRIKRNQNKISITQGPTGSGKTLVDISLARSIDPDFDVDKQVVFNLSELMKLLNSGWFKEKKWKVVIFEEAQITISNRAWQSAMNKMLNYLLSTFRHQNIILFFNAPFKDFLDAQSMKLIHLIITTKGINRKKKLTTIGIQFPEWSSEMKKYYYHSLFSIYPDGKTKQISECRIKKPPEDVCDRYEAKKETFTSKLNKSIERKAEELMKAEDGDDAEIIEPIHTLGAEELIIYNHIKDNQGKLQRVIASDLNISFQKVSKVIQKIEKKGVAVRKYLGKPDFKVNLKDSLLKSSI